MSDRDDDKSIPRGRLGRLTRIAGMATRVGADLATDRVKRLFGGKSTGPEIAAMRVLETLGSLKGAALKAGQTLSLFANHLPPEARAVVGKLFSQAPTLPYEDIAGVIRAELGAEPDELFAEFERAPLAGASLAQVHRAKLRSGEVVAVKVQYPGVAEALVDDLDNLGTLMKAVGVVFESADYLEELRREISAELDYRRELEMLERFRGYLARWPDLVVPRAYPELSTSRVLVLEFLEGPTLNGLTQSIDAVPAEERWRRADQIIRAGWGPLLLHRAVHADAHPGNYVLMPDGRLGVLDFGSVKEVSEPFWRTLRETVDALVNDRHEDWLPILERGGFELNLPPEKARPLINEIHEVARKPVSGERDFGQDTTLKEFASLKLRYPLELLRIRPPAESILVARGLAGVLQNLQALKARGDLRPFFRETLAVEASPAT